MLLHWVLSGNGHYICPSNSSNIIPITYTLPSSFFFPMVFVDCGLVFGVAVFGSTSCASVPRALSLVRDRVRICPCVVGGPAPAVVRLSTSLVRVWCFCSSFALVLVALRVRCFRFKGSPVPRPVLATPWRNLAKKWKVRFFNYHRINSAPRIPSLKFGRTETQSHRPALKAAA